MRQLPREEYNRAASQDHGVLYQCAGNPCAFSLQSKTFGWPVYRLRLHRVAEIRALIEQTKRKCAPLIELSDALAKLDREIRENAKGSSLQPLYRKVPDILRGYVELV